MKKYKIITIISIILFLVYRHEYNRLYNVLEQFNFFGQPCNISSLEESNYILNNYDWGPVPLWQENEDIYLYSAYWSNNNAKTIVLQTQQDNSPRNCYLWVENRNKPILGKFKYTKMQPIEGNYVYFYHCALFKLNEKPYAVSFIRKNKKRHDLIKAPLITHTVKEAPNFNATLCVFSKNYTKSALLEFLSYHTLIGIDSYLIYSNNIPYRLIKILTNFQTKLGIKLTFFHWNYPKNNPGINDERRIIENDCVLRTQTHAKYALTLELNEYVVPNLQNRFGDLFLNFVHLNFDRLKIPVREFCIESFKRNLPVALQNFNAKSSDSDVETIYNNVNFNSNLINNHVVDKSLVSIHKYVFCKTNKTYVDKSIYKYYTDFIRTTFVQLLIHNKI